MNSLPRSASTYKKSHTRNRKFTAKKPNITVNLTLSVIPNGKPVAPTTRFDSGVGYNLYTVSSGTSASAIQIGPAPVSMTTV